MNPIAKHELEALLNNHRLFLDGAGGERADLTFADLEGVDLSSVDLSKAILHRTNLKSAILRDVNFVAASLIDVILEGADLTGANLEKADLTNAVLTGAVFTGANMKDAILEGADAEEVVWPESEANTATSTFDSEALELKLIGWDWSRAGLAFPWCATLQGWNARVRDGSSQLTSPTGALLSFDGAVLFRAIEEKYAIDVDSVPEVQRATGKSVLEPTLPTGSGAQTHSTFSMVEPDEPLEERVVLYARVSGSDQRASLDRQTARLRAFAAARGMSIEQEIAEVGSGLNPKRKQILKLLKDAKATVIVIEHKDRLARFGVELIEAALAASGRKLVIMNKEERTDDIMSDFVDVMTSMCARMYGRRGAKARAERALKATQ